MHIVHSQLLNPPGEKCRGYGKQVWLLFTTQSYLFHSFSWWSGGYDVWEEYTVCCMHRHPTTTTQVGG